MVIVKKLSIILSLICVLSLMSGAANPPDFEKYWPQWRGPLASGVSPAGNPPAEWGETKNIKWKIAIPGKGHATPVIWGDQIFILTAVETEKDAASAQPKPEAAPGHRGMPVASTTKIYKFVVLSVDRRDGKILWQKTVKEERPQEGTHEFGSWASNSPVTDGEFLYAYFGSRGLFCLDLKGDLKWERDFGQLAIRMNFGEGNSPALYGDKIVVTWDQEGPSFITALNKKTGKDVWKINRDEKTSWATPLILEAGGKTQVITAATKRIRSYDLATGKLIWECGGLTQNAIPTPVEAEGIVYVMSGFMGNALLAIRLEGAEGDITDTKAVVWKLGSDTPYAPSPLLYEGKLYFLKSNNGILSCYDAKTGKAFYSNQRLDGMGSVFASPAAAKDRIYVLGQNGTMYTVKTGETFQILAKNTLEDNFNASPAIVDNQIYLRGYKNLYCIEQR